MLKNLFESMACLYNFFSVADDRYVNFILIFKDKL